MSKDTIHEEIIPERVKSRSASASALRQKVNTPVQFTSFWRVMISGALVLLVLLFVYSIVFLQEHLSSHAAQLDKLVERLQSVEDKLLVTDESLSQSGAAIQAVLQEQKKLMQKHERQLKQLKAADKNNLETVTNRQQESFEGMQQSLATVRQNIEESQSTISKIDAELLDLTKTTSANGEMLKVVDEQIGAINEARVQMNRRILDAQRTLNLIGRRLDRLEMGMKPATK